MTSPLPPLSHAEMIAMLGAAAAFLDTYARGTDTPGFGVVEAADLLERVRVALAREATP